MAKKKKVPTCDHCTKPYTYIQVDLRQQRILRLCSEHKPAPKDGEF